MRTGGTLGLLATMGAVALGAGPSLISGVIYPPASSTKPRAAPRPQVKAVEAKTAPALDGRFDEACWQVGEWESGFVLNDESGRKAEAQTLFRVAFDAANVYVAAKCLEPEMPKLKSFWGPRHDEGIFNDDCVELWFDVNNLHQRSYHIILSNAGGLYDAVDTQRVVDDPKAATVGVKRIVTDTDLSWDTKTVAACEKAEDHWTVEARVPVADLGVEEIITGAAWGFNIARERWAGKEEFSSISGVFQFPLDRYAELHFGEPRVSVRIQGADELGLGDNRVSLEVQNLTQESQRCTLSVEATSQEAYRQSREVTLAPAAKSQEEFICRFSGAGGCRLTVAALNARGDKIFQQECVTSQERAFDFSWHSRDYYLGESATASLSLHLGNVTRESARLVAAVTDENGREVTSAEVKQLRASSLRLVLNLAPLNQPGFYVLRLELRDLGGKELAREERPFRLIARPVFKERAR